MSDKEIKVTLPEMLTELRKYYHQESASITSAMSELEGLEKEERQSQGPELRHQMSIAKGHKGMIAKAIGYIETVALSRGEM